MTFAKGTRVDAATTRAEVDRMLTKGGCINVGVKRETNAKGEVSALVVFERQRWSVCMRVSLPALASAPQSVRFRRTSESYRTEWVEQQERERWRQLLLILKAKFASLESGIETFEECFAAHLLINDVPLMQRLLPVLREANKSGQRPVLTPALFLPAGGGSP